MHAPPRPTTAAICLLFACLLLMLLTNRPVSPQADRMWAPRASAACAGAHCFHWPESKRMGFGRGGTMAVDERSVKPRWSAEIVQVR